MKLHELKIESQCAYDIMARGKSFEVRKLSHGIEVGDLICSDVVDRSSNLPWAFDNDVYEVMYELTDPRFCKEGYGIYAIKRMKPEGEEV